MFDSFVPTQLRTGSIIQIMNFYFYEFMDIAIHRCKYRWIRFNQPAFFLEVCVFLYLKKIESTLHFHAADECCCVCMHVIDDTATFNVVIEWTWIHANQDISSVLFLTTANEIAKELEHKRLEDGAGNRQAA